MAPNMEKRLLAASPLKLLFVWERFIFSLWKIPMEEVSIFVNFANSFQPTINFTCEMSSERAVFLGTDVFKGPRLSTLKPGSQLCDKHNTSEISRSRSRRKKEHVSFFLCFCIPLTNRARGPYRKLRTEFFPPRFMGLARRGHESKGSWIEGEKTRIRSLQYGTRKLG